MGGVARVLKAYPGPWEIFAMGGDGSSELVTSSAETPKYQELEKARI